LALIEGDVTPIPEFTSNLRTDYGSIIKQKRIILRSKKRRKLSNPTAEEIFGEFK
jgi:hypothetical protein